MKPSEMKPSEMQQRKPAMNKGREDNDAWANWKRLNRPYTGNWPWPYRDTPDRAVPCRWTAKHEARERAAMLDDDDDDGGAP